MTLYLGPELALEGFPQDKLERLEDICSGPNPEYSSWEFAIKARPGLRYSKKFPQPLKTIQLYRYDQGKLFVPRGVLEEVVKYNSCFQIKDLTVSPPAPSLKIEDFIDGTVPRIYQQDSVDIVLRSDNGVLEAPTGSGKTLMGLMIIKTLGLKTLFIVHTKRLLEQTVDVIKKKLGIEPGIIGDGKFEIKDITVAMVQTMMRRDMKPYAKEFGLIIFDEAHHVPAKTFTQLTKVFYAKHFYGLTATPDERPDGLGWILYQTIGPKLHTVDRKLLQNNGTVLKPTIVRVNTPYYPSKQWESFDFPNHITELSKDNNRNNFIIKYIGNTLKLEEGIVLSDRVEHVEFLASELKAFNPLVYHGNLSKKDQKNVVDMIKNHKSNLTIATYSSIGEGFDHPAWNTLYLTTPFSSPVRLIQVLGRISRSSKGKTSATVYDFVDHNDSLLLERYNKRVKAYTNL